MTDAPLHPNWAFVLETAAALAPGGRLLDYGCGQGIVVAAGLKRGLDIWGADVFYGGSHGHRDIASERGLLDNRVFEIRDGGMPFESSSFDFVFHNQVFEHVADLDGVLREIRRVLKPGGLMLSLFPSADVWREGHCGVPFAHRFRQGSTFRYYWLLVARRLGLGTFHGTKTPSQWAREFGQWLDDWCYYRGRAEIVAAYARYGFTFESQETEYATFRLRHTGRGWAVPVAQSVAPLTAWAIRKLGTMVVLSRSVTA